MEIKTLTEVRADRVSVRVEESADFNTDRTTVVITVPAKMYDAEAAAEVLAGNYARAQVKIRELETQVREYDRDRHTERDRADKLAGEVEEQKGEVARLSSEVRRFQAEMQRRFTTAQMEDAKADARAEARASEGARIRSEIRAVVDTIQVAQAQARMEDSEAEYVQVIADALIRVQNLISN